ncbi:MAG: response regulator [Chloroflexota bacterium]|nr:MAG: response regulator [Chloroflexota bacterium]
MSNDEKIKVLIVDDIAETRENIRKLLQFELDFEIVGAARNGAEGIELAKELQPDVILMDINMPDIDGITATETIRSEVPNSQIVILTVQADPNYMRRAMLAGARDFLTKPPSVDEMIGAIRRAGELAHEERSRTKTAFVVKPGNGSMPAGPQKAGKVISVYSPKGGVGSTTLAVNLSVALHREESPVVLVDGNMEFGDVTVFLNQQAKNSIVDLAPRADELDPEVIEEVTMLHQESGIKVLAAPSRPEFAESVSGNQFARVLDFLRHFFSYIVVDCSSSLTDVTLATIDSSDLIILLTTQEIPAIKDARLFLDLLQPLKISRDRVLFVMNKYDKRIGIKPEKVSENFKQEVKVVIPFEEKVVLPSINRGIPFMTGEKAKAITRSFLSLSEVVRKRLAAEKERIAVDIPAKVRVGSR